MAILKIARMGHPVLMGIAEPVEDPTNPEIARLINDMVDTMADAPGIGLAAPQVHVAKRIVIYMVPEDRTSDGEGHPLTVLINPEIIVLDDAVEDGVEGCLSLPEHFAEVTRPDRVKIRYLDRDNKIREIEADELLSTCIQHEIDHLDGILFVDHVSALKRNMILRKLVKAKKLAQQPA